MDTVVQTATDPFAFVVQGLIQLRQMRRDGRADTDEAEDLRIEMDHAWYQLSSAQIDRANGIAADLFMLSDEEIFADVPEEQRAEAWLKPRIEQAHSDGDDWQLLHLLRHGPVWLTPDGLAHLRGSAYYRLGFPELALRFYQCAWQSGQRVASLALTLPLLQAQGRWDDVLSAAEQLLRAPAADLPIIATASHAVLTLARLDTEAVDQPLLIETVNRLQAALASAAERDAASLGLAEVFLAAGYRLLADRLAAVDDTDPLRQPLNPILDGLREPTDLSRAA